jgi:hypothetical protein
MTDERVGPRVLVALHTGGAAEAVVLVQFVG